ncbi:MAG: DNA polymerase III subunit gamma/tau [Candidatus Saccharimonadales bacterium]
MSQSLYRKYRSRGFDEIVGQSHVTELLKNAVKQGTFAHAYLFTGPRGTGKTSVARILAHEINNLPYTSDTTHLDIIEIDAASNRRIDDIRDLREKIHIAPSSAKYKVYIIDEVHMLTGESFNALLKTLEEPPAHAVFILATTEVHKVPATIISRTQRFHFRPGTVRAIVDHLKSLAKKEKILIDEDALALIARHSEGGFRDSVSLLDQVSSLKSTTISREDVENLLGLAPAQSIDSIVTHARNGQQAEAATELVKLLDSGIHPMSIASQLLHVIQQQATTYPALYELMGNLLDISRSHAQNMKLLAVIASFAANQPTATKSKAPAPVTATKTHSTLVAIASIDTPKSSKREEVLVDKIEHIQADEKPQQGDEIKIIEGFEWSVILVALKQESPALYSVVKPMAATMNGDVLTLRSNFALHRKKVESEKYMKQLVDCIKKHYNACPQIVVAEIEKRKLDSVESKIANIMGGGEAV